MNQVTSQPIEEPIISTKNNRLNLYPLQYPDVWHMYQQAKASFWIPEEIDLTQDKQDWDKLDANEKHFILMILAFFAGSDLIVNENLDTEFTSCLQPLEFKFIYHFQEMMEDIHSQQYQLLIEALVQDSHAK